jgi:UDP-N-acetylglucosamine acyltransferase
MAIHPTALVSPKAELDPSVEVGPHAIIDDHVRIGPRTRVGPRAWITGWTDIGPDNVIHHGCVIGHEPQDIGYDGSETFVKIGAGNTFREYVTVHRGATKEDRVTTIGDRCYFMVGSHVGHNCRVGNGVLMVNGAMLAGHVTVEDRANISGACLIHQFVRVGTLVMMAGGTRVNKDVPPYCMTYHSNDVVGLNTIGLRRAGVPPERRTALRAAFRTLYLSGLNIREALDQVRAMPQTPEIAHFLEFIAASKRGICSWRGGRAEEQEEE